MKAHSWVDRPIALALVCCLTGCESSFTGQLWENGQFRHVVKPAYGTPVEVFYSPGEKDFLITYLSEERFSPARRQFYLGRNVDRLESRRKPRYSSEVVNTLQPVPVNRGTNLLPAALITNSITIHTEHGVIGPYPLPAYEDGGGTALQVVLTPFAVAGDLAILGLIIGTAAAVSYAVSLGNTH